MGSKSESVAKCILCGAPLPDGRRRDRRYCREACRVMAYRERRRSTGAGAARPPATPSPTPDLDLGRIVLALAEKVAQLSDELATIKKILAESQAHRPVEAKRSPPIAQPAPSAEAKLQTIMGAVKARLQAEGTAPSPGADADYTRLSQAARSMGALPWMMVRPDDQEKLVPKWQQWNPAFGKSLDSYAERILSGLPDLLAKEGQQDVADQFRSWLVSDGRLLTQIASGLAIRIAATDRSERQSAEQRVKLAARAMHDLTGSLPHQNPTDKEHIETFLSKESNKLVILGACLAVVLRHLEGSPSAVEL